MELILVEFYIQLLVHVYTLTNKHFRNTEMCVMLIVTKWKSQTEYGVFYSNETINVIYNRVSITIVV